MYYPNDPTTLEASDIAAVYSDGQIVALPDGTTALTLYVTVAPRVAKIYPPAPFPLALFVTNGVEPRRMEIQPLPAGTAPIPAEDPMPEPVEPSVDVAPAIAPAPEPDVPSEPPAPVDVPVSESAVPIAAVVPDAAPVDVPAALDAPVADLAPEPDTTELPTTAAEPVDVAAAEPPADPAE